MAHLLELCLPCLRVKIKHLCLAHRKRPDQAHHERMAAEKKKLNPPLWYLAKTRKYWQHFFFFNFASSPSSLCSGKEASVQTCIR